MCYSFICKTAINLRIEQVLNEKVAKLTIPLHTNSVYVTIGLFCVSIVLIVESAYSLFLG